MPNKSQLDALAKINGFLVSPEKYFLLTGGPGYGKSYVVEYFYKHGWEEYQKFAKLMGAKQFQDLHITATTHAAAEIHAEVGLPCRTIHSLLQLVLFIDYKTGEPVLIKKKNCEPIHNAVIIIDEYTLTDPTLKRFIEEQTPGCKIILVGDPDQLLYVKGNKALWDRSNTSYAELTEQMRTESSSIAAAVDYFKGMVRGMPVQQLMLGDDLIAIDTDEAEDIVKDLLLHDEEFAILAHTNHKVIDYNHYIRKLKGLPFEYVQGEKVVNNTAVTIKLSAGTTLLIKTDQNLTVNSYDGNESITFPCGHIEEVHNYTVEANMTILNIKVPVDVRSYKQQLNKLKKQKDFVEYYHYADTLDLRPAYAYTIYKAQGKSIDTVIVDLASFPPNLSLNTLARALYVSTSRARKKVYLVGELNETLLGKF